MKDPSLSSVSSISDVSNDILLRQAQPHVKRVEKNPLGRDFAVGDVHGCFDLLRESLLAIGFSPDTDRLFSVGDLVDRGPQSSEVLDWLDQPWFFAVCGNHELLTWRNAFGNPYQGVEHWRHGGAWLKRLSYPLRQKIGHRLQTLPLVLEIPTTKGLVGLIHANCPFDDWAQITQQPLSEADEESCLWSISRYRKRDIEPIKNIRAVVHGHITVSSMQTLGNVYYIDTGGWKLSLKGCHQNGYFTFLNLETLTHLCEPNIQIIDPRFG